MYIFTLSSINVAFLQVNYTKIAANGIHEESWAILYYVTHLLKVQFFLLNQRKNTKYEIF